MVYHVFVKNIYSIGNCFWKRKKLTYGFLALLITTVILTINHPKPNEPKRVFVIDANSSISTQLKDYIDYSVSKLKIFIPKALGPEYNSQFQDRVKNKCLFFDRTNYGHGWLNYTDLRTNIGQFETDQFSTDLIFHNRIIQDKRVLVNNIRHANVIYIPFMMGSACGKLIYENTTKDVYEYKRLFTEATLWIKENKDLIGDKIVLLVNSRVMEEFYWSPNGISMNILKKLNVHMYSIEIYAEREMNYVLSAIPYATFTKFIFKSGKYEYKVDFDDNRDVDFLFTGGKRANVYRTTIRENIDIETKLDYDKFKKDNSNVFVNSSKPQLVGLSFDDCKLGENLFKSYAWKIHTKFCFEPVGDTPTRRSFWDSIMLGCIPVIFKSIHLPFSNLIDYKKFVLEFNATHIHDVKENRTKLHELFKPYMNKRWLNEARSYMSQVRQFIQFTWMYDESGVVMDNNFRYDAYGMILSRLASHL